MKTRLWASMMILLWFVFVPSPSPAADFFGDTFIKGLPKLPGLIDLTQGPAAVRGLDDQTIASGLKEALSIGTKNAVGLVSRLNGYFGNDAIKILLPDKVQQAADLLGKTRLSEAGGRVHSKHEPRRREGRTQGGVPFRRRDSGYERRGCPEDPGRQ